MSRVIAIHPNTWRNELRPLPSFDTLAAAVLVACAYYGGAKLGLSLTPPDHAISTLWPPNALLLAVLLLTPLRRWFVLLAATFPVHMFVQLSDGIPQATAVGWYFSNIGEAVLGAACLRAVCFRCRTTPHKLFESLREFIYFVLLGVLLAPLLTSFLDAAVVVQTGWGRDFWRLWRDRSVSNMLANLTVIPPIIAIGSQWRSLQAEKRRYLEAGLLAAAIILIVGFVFGPLDTGLSVAVQIYLLLPFLLWAAVRFGSGGASASLLLVALLSIWNAIHDRGPFRQGAGELLSLQIFLSVTGVPLLCLAAVLAERKRAFQALAESEQRFRQANSPMDITEQKNAQAGATGLSGRLIKAQEEERQRIARELHDDIGQRLALLAIDLGRLQRDPDSCLERSLPQLLNEAQSISEGVRSISHNLHSARLDLLPLGIALQALCREFRQRAPFELYFEEHSAPAPMRQEVKLCLYRVAQEALQNVAKHSGATRAKVELTADVDSVTLTVQDDGAGFAVDENALAGLGLASMRERVSSVAGTMRITAAHRQGTRIEAHIPLHLAAHSGMAECA